MSVSQMGFQFDPEWRITLFTVIMIPLLVFLGFWQLQRADEKSVLASAFEDQQRLPPAPITSVWQDTAEKLAYRPVQLRGEFLADTYFLLDNRIRNGRFGYEVLHVLQLSNAETVLVNRGWVAGDASRQVLPQLETPTGTVQVSGHVYVAPGKPYLLAAQKLEDKWPQRVQAVEMNVLQQQIEKHVKSKLFPYPVRINANEPGALQVEWKVINLSPEKHTGYAVQWFAMAVVLAVVYIFQSSNLWTLLRGKKVA